jgi:hypothetical protein
VYQVTSQLKILTTAGFSVLLLGRQLQPYQVFSALKLTDLYRRPSVSTLE